VEDERTRRIREMAGQDLAADGGGEVRAPMPGRIVRILVDVGQEVEPGTPLLTIEAMKMENELRAERRGVVARIEVEEGETVNQDAVLAVLEEPGAEED
jgi:biotin carboxyl carrier protein